MSSAMLLSLLIIGVTYISGSFSHPSSSSSAASASLVQNFNPVLDTSWQPNRRGRQDYTYITGVGAYKVHTQAADWDTCRRTCMEEQGNLVVINSRRESEVVSELARNAGPPTGSLEAPEYLHIGIHNRFDRNEWVTIDGSSLIAAGFSEWDVGQPNRGDKACGCINYTTGKFDDSACTTALAYICELPYTGY